MYSDTLKITYLYHSGFAVETANALLLFDYWRDDGEGGLDAGRIDPAELPKYDEVLIFVSHAHSDHYNPVILDYARANANVRYILSSDVPPIEGAAMLKPGDEASVGGAQVRAFGSTDQGASFYVEYNGFHIFHAGDLNWWHWRDESSSREIDQAERDFKEEMAKLAGLALDAAFFPVDPRQGNFYDAGALFFAMELKPRALFPMHFHERADAVGAFARRARNRHTKVYELTARGASAQIQREAANKEE